MGFSYSLWRLKTGYAFGDLDLDIGDLLLDLSFFALDLPLHSSTLFLLLLLRACLSFLLFLS